MRRSTRDERRGSRSTTVKVQPVYALVGESWLLRNEALERILEVLSLHSYGGPPVRCDGLRAEPADVLDELRTPSLLGGGRIVIVDDAEKLLAAHREVMEAYCAAPDGSGFLILITESLDQRTRLFKTLKQSGAVVACQEPQRREAVPWLIDRAEDRYGKALSRPVAEMLIERLGLSLGGLDSELSKLAAYVGARERISEKDVEALSDTRREEKIFAVMDAVEEGDVAAALQRWDQVLATDRSAPDRAIGGMAWKVRTRLDQLRGRASSAILARLEAQRRGLLEVDLAVKTGASSFERAVEKFVVTHACMTQRTAR